MYSGRAVLGKYVNLDLCARDKAKQRVRFNALNIKVEKKFSGKDVSWIYFTMAFNGEL
jgi:hypothetical protein